MPKTQISFLVGILWDGIKEKKKTNFLFSDSFCSLQNEASPGEVILEYYPNEETAVLIAPIKCPLFRPHLGRLDQVSFFSINHSVSNKCLHLHTS